MNSLLELRVEHVMLLFCFVLWKIWDLHLCTRAMWVIVWAVVVMQQGNEVEKKISYIYICILFLIDLFLVTYVCIM